MNRTEELRQQVIEQLQTDIADFEKYGGDEFGSASAGFRGSASAGKCGSVVSRGKSSVGVNGIACVRGNGCMVRGGMGAVLVIAEESMNSYDITACKSVVVDGNNIKADTWYKLESGELVEVGDV